jgi:putative transposase
MGHTYSDILLHIVFSTKERRRWIDAALKERLLPYIGGIAEQFNATLLASNGIEDHVHLLIMLPPAVEPAGLVRAMKAGSSRWIHEQWPELAAFGWQEGYGVFSVSRSAISAVRQYLEEQEEHHHKRTFQEELRGLLKQHGIPFDEKYIWG